MRGFAHRDILALSVHTVTKVDDAAIEPEVISQFERCDVIALECRLSSPQDDGMDEEMTLIHHARLQGHRRERGATDGEISRLG